MLKKKNRKGDIGLLNLSQVVGLNIINDKRHLIMKCLCHCFVLVEFSWKLIQIRKKIDNIYVEFLLVEISPESREITTFMTRKGLFRYKRLMFGISCAPEIFQKLLEQILSGLEGVMNFIDDIIVHAPTKEIHDLRLRKLLDQLREYRVTLNKEKCQFGVTEIEFYGHHLSSGGIKPMHNKVEAVQNFREPTTAEETRSFLGLVNYVAKFIPNLATFSEPLRQLTKKDSVFAWGPEQQQAFDHLNRALTSDLLLGYYDVNCETQVVADASPVGLEAVLIQFQKGDARIISYAEV